MPSVALGVNPLAGHRSKADWQLEAEVEYWSRARAEYTGADATTMQFLEASRDEVQDEIDRRQRLAYRRAQQPFDLTPVIQEVKRRADVLDIFATRAQAGAIYGGRSSQYINGKIARFICPFHAERTPSCMVYREQNRWRCYGCGQYGDVIAAVMKLDGLEFVPAVLQLAQEYGVTVPERPRSHAGILRLARPS